MSQVRTVQEIQKEYTDVCGQAGDIQYRIKILQEQLDLLNQKLKDLNQEGHALIEADQKAQAEAIAKAAVDAGAKEAEAVQGV